MSIHLSRFSRSNELATLSSTVMRRETTDTRICEMERVYNVMFRLTALASHADQRSGRHYQETISISGTPICNSLALSRKAFSVGTMPSGSRSGSSCSDALDCDPWPGFKPRSRQGVGHFPSFQCFRFKPTQARHCLSRLSVPCADQDGVAHVKHSTSAFQ